MDRCYLSTLVLSELQQQFPHFNIRCGILLIRKEDARILIVKEKPRRDFVGNVYGPPKGAAMRRDGNCVNAACRELYEETKIAVNASHCLFPYFVFKHEYFRELLVLFPAIIEHPPEPQPDPREIAGCFWMSLEELKNSDAPKSSFTRSLIDCLYKIGITTV